MRKDKKIAIKLRKDGFSYSQINQKLSVPKSTLSSWLKKIKLSKKAERRILKRVYVKSIKFLIKRNKKQTVLAQKRYEVIKSQSEKEIIKLMKNQLFIVGLSLYWAEGYKKGAFGSKWKSVDFANSDPTMVKIMMKFFRKICGINNKKIRIQLIAHRNISISKAVKFWSKITALPNNQFVKTSLPSIKINKNNRKNKTLKFGTIHIRISDVKLFFKIIGWIEGLKKSYK